MSSKISTALCQVGKKCGHDKAALIGEKERMGEVGREKETGAYEVSCRLKNKQTKKQNEEVVSKPFIRHSPAMTLPTLQ